MGKTVGTGVNIDLMIVGVMKTETIKMATKKLTFLNKEPHVLTHTSLLGCKDCAK